MADASSREPGLFDQDDFRRQSKLYRAGSDPYLVLGLERGASQAEIRRAYFGLVRDHTPEQEPEQFKIIRAAYERLRTDAVQAETDLFLLQEPPDWVAHGQVLELDVAFHTEDALAALLGWGDMSREDFSDEFREVTL